MAKILITSGPTRQYLDPVRYLTNASSGRMGAALATAAIEHGHEVVIVSGPVNVAYPPEARVVEVVTTQQMLDAAHHEFDSCDGAIGAAAPCDYQPQRVETRKIAKTGKPITLHLIETPDVVATLGQRKRRDQWVVGFALEVEDRRFRAIVKLEKKHCDLMVSNGPEAIDALSNDVELIDADGQLIRTLQGSKQDVARGIIGEIESRLIPRASTTK
ncbi:MAG: phosphopantothenoylcysteine decarboxylase [Pirellulaceae bacterium]